MVDLAEIQAAYYMVAATGVLVAAGYYILNMRETQRNSKAALETRQAQLFMGIYQFAISRDFILLLNKTNVEVKDWDDFERFRKDQERNTDFTTIALFFEGIGVLVRENLVDVRLVSLLISGAVTGWWKKWGPYIVQARAKWGFPRWCIEVEYLNDRIMEYGREHPDLQIVPHLAEAIPLIDIDRSSP